ncbi:MAG: DUF2007 domain-containing protein [Kangiellaceae bacterium]|nr:DUF2007 domain-containing protein [Kangiellaceae bacterium]
MSLVVVETYTNTMQAHIAKGLLESHGINAVLMHEQFHSTYAFALGEIPLMVDDENCLRAKEILSSELIDEGQDSFSA